MGKSSNDRRAAAAKALQTQRAQERRRNLIFSAVIAVIVVGLLAAAVIPYLRDPEKTEPATGGGKHIAQGSDPGYGEQPPAFGQHYPEWADFERKFYTADDRPMVGNLVHNLEHGYTVVWYDPEMPQDQIDELKDLSAKFEGSSDNEDMVIVAPWTAEDGTLPEGKTIAMTHWSADPDSPTDEKSQKGVWQYCGQVSGEAIKTFLDANPWSAAPEPGVQ